MYTAFVLADRDIDLMAKACSDDLRCKFLVAFDAGQSSLRVLAERFSVSYDYAKKVSAQRLRTGESKRVEQSRHGRVSRVTPEVEAQLLRLLRKQPDLILVELQQGIKAAAGVDLSRAHLWCVLKRLGLLLKKSHSTPSSVTPKPTAYGASSTLPASAKHRRRS